MEISKRRKNIGGMNMPSLRDYHILISHSWDYSSDYQTIKGWLNDAKNFDWTDYSVPLTKPLDVN